MSENLSTNTAKIRALGSTMVSILEESHDQGIPSEKIWEGAQLLVESCQDVLNRGTKLLVRGVPEGLGQVLPSIENAYTEWKVIDAAFSEAMRLAYSGCAPRKNLMLDAIHEDLKRQVGEPVAALYARLHTEWRQHLESAPWDAYLAGRCHNLDGDDMHGFLNALSHGDHFDLEDAIEHLTGELRFAFAGYLERDRDRFDTIEESLWMRPEIVVMNDYWQHGAHARILEVVARTGTSRYARTFAKIHSFFTGAATSGRVSESQSIVDEVNTVRPEDKDAYLRCLMIHPVHEVRRYAVTNVDMASFWNVTTPQAVPCATILTMMERVAGSQMYNVDFQKVFFRTIYRRLLALSSRSEVLYARGIVRILVRLPFFMEDEYFEKLRHLIDYLSEKEKHYQIADGLLESYVEQLRREKDRIGTLDAVPPSLTAVPPVVLRKLARDGHYWYELATHPMYKIAKETVFHINTPDRALRVANNHMVNRDVLREIGKRRSLFTTAPSKLTLLSNPRTPVSVSLPFVADLPRSEIEHLLRRSTIHPELRTLLRKRLNT